MRQSVFEARHGAEWSAFEQMLSAPRSAATGRGTSAPAADPVEFPAAYRRLCQQLALAERRGYGLLLIQRLRGLVELGHQRLYRPPRARWQRVVGFFANEFPALVRSQRGPMLAASALFFVPLIACLVLLQFRPELASLVLPPQQLAQMEAMYDPAASHTKLGRDSGSDLQMFGFYVMNNVSIGFRTFALGLIAGIGSVLVLLANGVVIGSVAGHLTAIGSGDPFWRFVSGHSAPELLAIAIAGGAGLQLGLALLAPGQRTRLRAFREAGLIGARLCLGIFAMLVFAAFIEAFWSSIGWIPAGVKYAVGASLWVLMLAWLLLAGRGRGGLDAD